MGVLDRLQQEQGLQDNQDLSQASHDATWASTFSNTPPVDVLRSRVNLADTVDRAISNKIALQAKSDVKALDLMHKTAQFKEWQDQAPAREQLLQAHVDATGATERRKALEATTQAQQTAALNNGMLKLYQSGVKYGTPEFQQGVVGLIADNPMAKADHISEIGKMAQLGADMSPDEYIAKAVEMKKAAQAAGLSNPTIKSFSGKPTVVEEPVPVSADESIDNAVKRKKALQAVDPVKAAAMTPQEKEAATDASIGRGTLTFGILDDKGKLVPNKADDAASGKPTSATHVISFYSDPISGRKVKTPPMTIEEFKAFQERAKRAQKPSTPASFDTPEDFTAAFQSAKPGEIIHYKGKAYTKP